MKKIALFLIIVLCMSFVSCKGSEDGSNGTSGTPHTVSFDTNGGSAVAKLEISSLNEAPITEKENYVFCGWYLDSSLINPVSYPMQVKSDMTLYAKWTGAHEIRTLPNSAVQFSIDNEYNYKAEYDVNPKTLDIETLAENGYYVKIDVTYEVYYEKNFDISILYAGAPDHDVYIRDMYEEGAENSNLSTEKEPKTESISLVVNASEFREKIYYVGFLTYNAQNTVYFQNISVTYSCHK